MGTFRILIADKLSDEAILPLREDPRFEIVEHTGLKGEELARTLTDFDSVIVRSATKITRQSLEPGSRLRVIGRAGVGVDNIDVQAATEKGIAVLNAPSGNTISAAELTMALLLAAVRRVPDAHQSMKRGEWDRKSFTGTELHAKTMGLVGAGRIGGEVARRARAFGMTVVAFDPYLSEERARSLEIELVELDEVMRRADVLSLHTPFTEATANLINADRLALMKPTAYVVNVGRGGVLDEGALFHALQEKRLAGAAMDVFEQEPLPADHPLRGLDNIVLTPHLGASTEEAQQSVAFEIIEAVRAALVEGDYARAVNAPAIGGEAMRRMRPLLDLGERLGTLAAAMRDTGMESVEVRYAGDAEDVIRPLTSAVLIGLFNEILGRGAANLVNAVHLAESRGTQVRRVRTGPQGAYAQSVEVRVVGGGVETCVAGALLAEGFPRIVRINAFRVDIVPRGALVVVRNRDVPGVIGRVGTVMGGAGVNIAEYHQARLQQGGQALAAISVDGRLEPSVVEMLARIPEIEEVRQVQLD